MLSVSKSSMRAPKSRDVPTQITRHPGPSLSTSTEKVALHKVLVWDIPGSESGYLGVWSGISKPVVVFLTLLFPSSRNPRLCRSLSPQRKLGLGGDEGLSYSLWSPFANTNKAKRRQGQFSKKASVLLQACINNEVHIVN